jgi:oligoendopeptidase F
MDMAKRLTRAEIPVELTWNLDDLFASEEEWAAELSAVQEDVTCVTQYQGRLGEGAQFLLACLKEFEALQERLIRVATYASLRFSEDGSNPVNQARSMQTAAALSKIGARLTFIESEVLDLPEGTVQRYLQEEPELAAFRRMLEDLEERKPHRLSLQTEQVLAALGQVLNAPYAIYQRGKASDMQFHPVVDTNGNEHPVSLALYEDRYELSPDTELRREAYGSFVRTLDQYKNTFAAVYATEVNKQMTLARLRGYASITEMLLQPQHVTLEMYNNQLDVIQAELAPHMQRWAKLKRRVLGLDKMLHCDLKAPLDPTFSPKTSREEAAQLILQALSVLGQEYREIIETAFRERWIDFADNVGKSTGAFCSSPYGVHPYILITWTDTMRSAFVLAHELGHAGHFVLAQRNQTLMNTRPSMYFIEAPSTMNEQLLAQYILAQSKDPRMRRWVIEQLLGTYYHNFVTHLLEGELQRRVYALAESGKAITAKVLCEQMGEVLQSFWGDAVEIDDGARLTWMRQPHYYMGLYPYTYSAGLTVSTAMAQRIREEGQPAVDQWLTVLKAGGTLRPLELIRLAGVDMSKPDAIRAAVAYVASLIDELERSYSASVDY